MENIARDSIRMSICTSSSVATVADQFADPQAGVNIQRSLERSLRIERSIAPADLKADGFGWRIASPAFVERWKLEDAELTARGYRVLYNRVRRSTRVLLAGGETSGRSYLRAANDRSGNRRDYQHAAVIGRERP